MNRNICVLLCMLAILLTACSNPKQQEVGRNNHERIEKEEQEKWEVTDTLGNKQTLDISNVPVMNQNVEMGSIYYPEEYIQIYDGHCYYMTYEDKIYTLYMDHGNKVGKFQCEDGYAVAGCVKYKASFYVVYYMVYTENEDASEESENIVKFGRVDFDKQTIKYLFTQIFEIVPFFHVTICDEQICFTDLDNYYTQITDFKGNCIKSFGPPDQKKGWWKYFFRGADKKNYIISQ